MISATDRAVLPPLEVEVVAGNQRQPLAASNSSVKVEMQPAAGTGETTISASVPEGNADAHVSLSPNIAERVTRPVQPSYPLLAKQMKVQGAVVLQALIDKTGHIQDLHVVSGPTILAAAAREAVKQWHFKPYYQAGQAVETEARITVNFTISTY
jgi:protein TonB